MGPMPVISMQPARELGGAFVGMGVRLGISPLAERGLDEALGLAVSFWGVGAGAEMPQAEFEAGVAEGEGAIAAAVVGHDALHTDAQAGIAGDGRREEGDRGFLALIRPDLSEGDPGVVIDAHMDTFPADAPGVIARISGNPVADGGDATELLDVEVEQLPRSRPFVAHDR